MPSENHFPAAHPINASITIPASSDTSSSYKVFGSARVWNVTVLYLITPSGLQGTTLSLQMSLDNSVWYPVYDDEGNAITAAVSSTARCVRLYPTEVAGFPYVRFVSDSSQSSERTLTLGLYIV